MCDIALSNSYFLSGDPVGQRQPYFYPPLGPMYVAAYLRRRPVGEVKLIDTTFLPDVNVYGDILRKHRPRIVGLQTIITNRTIVRKMIALAKQTGASVVVGGPDASASPDYYLDHGADYAVVGEGEVTMAELVERLLSTKAKDLRDVPGLAFRASGVTIATPPRAQLADPDALPFPAYDLVDVDRYLDIWRRRNGHTSLHVLTSRGCPFTCTWCSRAVFGRSFRQRSVRNVIDEVRYLQERYAPDTLWFADDTFTLKRRWVEEWCEMTVRENVVIPFRCFTRADVIDPALAAKLRIAGCRRVHMGVESGSQKVLDAMGKRTSPAVVRKAATCLREAGIAVNIFIMFGYPSEKLDDIIATEQLIADIRPDSIGFSIAYPVPGTEFHAQVKHRMVRNSDALWAKTKVGPQLMFRAEFPLVYYRLLIRLIQMRFLKPEASATAWSRWWFRAECALLHVARFAIETIWLIVRTIRPTTF